jgi:hypothetical protein
MRALKGWEAVGVDRVNFLLNTNEVISQADVLASLRLFAREVMPAFSDSKPVAGSVASAPATKAGGDADLRWPGADHGGRSIVQAA